MCAIQEIERNDSIWSEKQEQKPTRRLHSTWFKVVKFCGEETQNFMTFSHLNRLGRLWVLKFYCFLSFSFLFKSLFILNINTDLIFTTNLP